MKQLFPLLAIAVALSACGGSNRPTYSGHEESTQGVPGFSKTSGKKLSPYAKLGQSYSVAGETYVPRHQPDYVEEGMASWYGPGFHGGKTANGEAYDKHEMTAAHKTLPLPSMVRVTMVETGKSAIVRVNDRGPFSKGRIIDLSYAAAKEIGLIAKGVAKVRVEYLKDESEKFASLMSEGRDPKSIDVAEEVLKPTPEAAPMMVASSSVAPEKATWKERLNPISSAHAEEVDSHASEDAGSNAVSSRDLAPPAAATTATAAAPSVAPSPFQAMQTAEQLEKTEAAPASVPAVKASAPAIVAIGSHFLQLGAFSNEANAIKLRDKVASLGAVHVEPKVVSDTNTLYVVRMGPYADAGESARITSRLTELGVTPKSVSQ